MKKKIIGIILVISLFVIGIALICFVSINNVVNPSIGRFILSDYQIYIDECPSEETVGEVVSARDVISKAEDVWIRLYGESIRKEKPYQVFYDSTNKVWLVHGSLPEWPVTLGGVAYILIENDTGNVLAVWHEQ